MSPLHPPSSRGGQINLHRLGFDLSIYACNISLAYDAKFAANNLFAFRIIIQNGYLSNMTGFLVNNPKPLPKFTPIWLGSLILSFKPSDSIWIHYSNRTVEVFTGFKK